MSPSSTPLRLAAFAVVLAVVFAAAFGVGRWVGPLDVAGDEHDEPAGHAAAGLATATDLGDEPPGGRR